MAKTSLWRAKAESSDFNPLAGETSADVVIIGGGITGITAAYLICRAGLKVIVLESMSVGGGTTGFSTGYLSAPTVRKNRHQLYSAILADQKN